MIKVHALLLAAGASQRMGSPKQLLPWGNQTLIEHQIETLQKARLKVSVVLGANSELIKEKIKNANIHVLFNENWEKGMGSSIAMATTSIKESQRAMDAVLITLVDQPLLTLEHYNKMLDAFQIGKRQIIMSQTEKGLGSAPVLFDVCYLEELKDLQGDVGAKTIIREHEKHVIRISCKSCLEDMDTPEAYERLLNKFSHQS